MQTITLIHLEHSNVQQEAQRIAKRLVNHWKHKFQIEQLNEYQQTIHMPDASIRLQALDNGLHVTIETQDKDIAELERVVLDHLNRMAQQEFQVEWQRQDQV